MLATAADSLPGGEGWAYEFKWDGVRVLLEANGGVVRLFSRRGNEVTVAYPEIVAQAAGIEDAVLDGEIVAFVDGTPSFQALQARMHVRSRGEARKLALHTPVTYVVFDVLRRFGVELGPRPYTERRATLERWLGSDPAWTLSPAFDDGPATESAARAHGLEGVIAKRATSTYRPGTRSADWVKIKFIRTGDFAVVGWEAPDESPDTLSSLVLARAEEDGWQFAGKVGSGLSGRVAATLQRRLTPRGRSVFADLPPRSAGRVTYWVEPEIVVEVEYQVTTTDGRLRHPVFCRVRDDKTVDEL